MADTEKLHIKLGISGSYWRKLPSYRVVLNESVMFEGTITAESDQLEYLEFDCEYSTDLAVLKLQLFGKTQADTIVDSAGNISKDMLLNIHSIEVDGILLDHIPYNHGKYLPDHATEAIDNCVNLGWNGTWSLTWKNPFYIWLLENL